MKFRVTVRRTTVCDRDIDVEAPNQTTAATAARSLAGSFEFQSPHDAKYTVAAVIPLLDTAIPDITAGKREEVVTKTNSVSVTETEGGE